MRTPVYVTVGGNSHMEVDREQDAVLTSPLAANRGDPKVVVCVTLYGVESLAKMLGYRLVPKEAV
jgi:hypothetical protein